MSLELNYDVLDMLDESVLTQDNQLQRILQPSVLTRQDSHIAVHYLTI